MRLAIKIPTAGPVLGRYRKMLMEEHGCDVVIPLTHQVTAQPAVDGLGGQLGSQRSTPDFMNNSSQLSNAAFGRSLDNLLTVTVPEYMYSCRAIEGTRSLIAF